MLHKIKELYGNSLAASDGCIGHVDDFYFDDQRWGIRYLIADTGNWMPGRMVLLSPHAFGHLNQSERELQINLTRQQIEDSPAIEAHIPVSRQYEMDYNTFYNWPLYWNGDLLWGVTGYPMGVSRTQEELDSYAQEHLNDDKHLQSTHAVHGYSVIATDGKVGHLSDFLVDGKSWRIEDLAIETGHWYSGKEILISTSNVTRISYEESKVFVNLAKSDIEQTGRNQEVTAGLKP